ncbi:MAG: LLM class flavin-dependent oxidoreductase [Acidimicrobiaceae bacterium]|nr:LLM class flavin-dependent oxidoreductase [Acidimicrobiaceae bacterium]
MLCEPLAAGSVSLRLYPHDVAACEQLELIRSQAESAVSAGYDGVMVSEHHANFPGYLPNPIQLAGFLLGSMSAGWAAPCPLLLPMRPYALVAEDLAWLDAAYPGRVGAGFAAGALPVDFELAEVPFNEIVERFKDALPKVVNALRGQDVSPLGADRAIARTADSPLPMVVAAQSPAAARRAAALDLGVLYDSLQTAAVTARLGEAYREADGTGPRIAIRRVWIGDPPTEQTAEQMAHYRSYAPDRAMKNWDGDQLIAGPNGAETADMLADFLTAADCDTVNVRIHVSGLEPAMVEEQLRSHAEEFLPRLRQRMAALHSGA